MKRLITLAGLALVFAAMFGLYELSYRVDRQEARLRELANRTDAEKQAIAVLRAEWAYLTRPQAIQNRAVGNLGMLPPLPRQMVSFSQVPERQQRLITTLAGGAEGERLFATTLGGDLIPLPRRRPGELAPDRDAPVLAAAQAQIQPAPEPAIIHSANLHSAVVRTVAAAPPEREAGSMPRLAQGRSPAGSQRAQGGTNGVRLLPPEMEARLLKVAAQQRAGGGTGGRAGEGR